MMPGLRYGRSLVLSRRSHLRLSFLPPIIFAVRGTLGRSSSCLLFRPACSCILFALLFLLYDPAVSTSRAA
jgi:hypothetical protein